MADFELMPSSELWATNPAAGGVSGLRPRKEAPVRAGKIEKENLRHHKNKTDAAADAAADAITKAVQLLLWDNLPVWAREGNHYIETGYRPVNVPIKDCLHSMTYLHNETINIFSHLIGALLFFALPVYVFSTEIPPRYAVATTTDKVVSCAYFLGVAFCFVFSTIFHMFLNHSAEIFSLGLKLDFQGVILLMWGANIPVIYYGFVCEPQLQFIYWSLITALAFSCSVFTFQPQFSNPHLRPLRAATFGSLAMSTFIPVFHGIYKYGYRLQSRRISLFWIMMTLLFNTVGAGAYAFKFPERWYPRRFDIFGASHQIMHIAILIAGFMFAFAVIDEFDYMHAHPTQCASQ
ncbi:hypothetical protein OQA88_9920 [Cercophora sp. LCS_1]